MNDKSRWKELCEQVVAAGGFDKSPAGLARLVWACEVGDIDQHTSEDLWVIILEMDALRERVMDLENQLSPISTPQRIQRKRARGWRKPAPGVADCTRAGKWGNDYRVVKSGRALWYVVNDFTGYSEPFGSARLASAHAVDMFEREQLPGMDVSELAGKTLMCWCAVGEPCHADSILKKANNAQQ
jgi:hypothetical protein